MQEALALINKRYEMCSNDLNWEHSSTGIETVIQPYYNLLQEKKNTRQASILSFLKQYIFILFHKHYHLKGESLATTLCHVLRSQMEMSSKYEG
jgi:hypothetical protein